MKSKYIDYCDNVTYYEKLNVEMKFYQNQNKMEIDYEKTFHNKNKQERS